MGLTDFWSRKRFITGDNAGSYDDANPDYNGGTTGNEGYLEEIPKSNIVTSGLWRVLKLKTILYQLQKFAVHKTEDRATKTDLGVDTEPAVTDLKFPVIQQLPSVDEVVADFTISYVEADGMLRNNVKVLNITEDLTGKGKKSIFTADVQLIKLILARTTSSSTQNFYVDGNSGSDTLGSGSILKPYKTVHWAAHKARQFSFVTTLPVTITVYGSTYNVPASEPINGETVIDNLWIYGGWEILPAVLINHTGGFSRFLFDSANVPASQLLGDMTVRGVATIVSNGGVIKHVSNGFNNYSLNYEWQLSTSANNFIYQDKNSGSDAISIVIKNGTAKVTTDNVSCIYCSSKPAITATDCYLYNTTATTVPNIDFSSTGVDVYGIYSSLVRCHIGSSNGAMGQIRVGRDVRILDIVDCEFFGSTTSTRACIRLESALLNIGSPIRVLRNYVSRRISVGSTPTVMDFIYASADASIIAESNNCHSARLSAGAGATLTTLSLDRTIYPRVVNPSTSYPTTLASDTDNVWSPAYNIWI